MLKKDDQRGNPLKEAHENRETLIDKIKNVLTNKFVIIGILGVAVIGVTFYLGMDNSEKNMKEDFDKVQEALEKELEKDNKLVEETREDSETEFEVRVPTADEYSQAQMEGRMLALEKDTKIPMYLLERMNMVGILEKGNEPYYELSYKLKRQKGMLQEYFNKDIVYEPKLDIDVSENDIILFGDYATMEDGLTKKDNIYYGHDTLEIYKVGGENYGLYKVRGIAGEDTTLAEVEKTFQKLKPEYKGKKLESVGEYMQREGVHGITLPEYYYEEYLSSMGEEDLAIDESDLKKAGNERVKELGEDLNRKRTVSKAEVVESGLYDELKTMGLNPKSEVKITRSYYKETGEDKLTTISESDDNVVVHKGEYIEGNYIVRLPKTLEGKMTLQLDKKSRVLGLIGDLREETGGSVTKSLNIENLRQFYEN